MKPLKFIHTADIHFSRENQEKALASLKTVCETAEREKVDLIIIAGDLFDRPVQNTDSAGFPALFAVIQHMMNIAPVVAVRGTPTHDAPGCYEPFQKIEAIYRFTMLEPSQPYFLAHEGERDFVSADPWSKDDSLLIFGIPELGKEWFLKDRQLGKDEANEEIKRGMRQLLLGLAARRAEHPDIPCVLVYHGAIAGASLSANQILPAGGIQIGRDDLALVGADYYALGHIHMAQQIENLPAYYAGSAFPVDWAETDKKMFNLVEIGNEVDGIPANGPDWEENYVTSVQFISYPHPPRKKIVINPENDMIIEPDLSGFQVWIDVHNTKEGFAKWGSTPEEDLAHFIKDEGCLPGSRVTYSIIPTETIRASEIQNAVKLRDKVQIYALNSQQNINPYIVEKAALLELEAQTRGEITEGLHIKIKKLSLRGAIGILKGTGRDQVEIDFAHYDPGLVALVGVNGSGKTTLIENMHPYSQMLTRSGKLQDHFYLRDSFRDLTFTDERTGSEYRAFIQIDGANKSGGAEYFLYRNGEPITNGRKDDYEEKILQLFGSLPLYLRSAFVSQRQPKNLPDLTDATKGEKKALFRELGGLDYLQIYSESAKAKAQTIGEELIGIRAKVEREGEVSHIIHVTTLDIEDNEVDAKHMKSDLDIVKARGFELKQKSDTLSAIVKENDSLRIRMKSLEKQIDESNHEHLEILTKIAGYDLIIAQKDEIEGKIVTYESLKVEEAKLNEERARINEEKVRLINQWNDETKIVEDIGQSLRNERNDIEHALADLRQIEALTIQEANGIEKELLVPLSENCPTCKQPWPPIERKRFEMDRRNKSEELERIKAHIFALGKDIAEKKRQVADIEKKIGSRVYPLRPDLPLFDEKALSILQAKILKLDISSLREKQKKLSEASVRIEERKQRIKQLEAQRTEKEDEYDNCLKKIDEKADSDYETVQSDLESARQDYMKYESALAKIIAAIEHLQKEKVRLEGELVEIEKLKASALVQEKDQREWEYLQRACGPDGIQALELDAMGPGIADVANNILESAYGSRFRIEFRTTRIGGSGSKTKQIEDFQIWIHDSSDGSEQLLETLSGGESVWVKRSIYDAFGIIRDRKTGQRFLTVFMDEADGALDPEARINYVKMIERAHQEAGRSHTIVITHSIEAQEMIGQKIEMGKIAESVILH
jgi:exonuclease SbcC